MRCVEVPGIRRAAAFLGAALLTVLGSWVGASSAEAAGRAKDRSELNAAQQARLDAASKAFEEVGKLSAQGKLTEAIALAKPALATHEELLIEMNPDVAAGLGWMGYLLMERGDYAAARPYNERAVAIWKELAGDKHPYYALALNNLGMLLKRSGDYAAARPCLETCLAIALETNGEKNLDTAQALDNLGAVQEAMGDYPAARKSYERLVAINQALREPKDPEIAASHKRLADVLYALTDYAAALTIYEQVLAVRKQLLGEQHLDYAESLIDVGWTRAKLTDAPGARRAIEQALAIRKAALGEKHPEYGASVNNFAVLLLEIGDYPAARSWIDQALAIRKEVLGEKNADYAQSMNNLGMILERMGDYPAARPCFERALAIWTETRGAQTPETAFALNNLGALLKTMGDYPSARACLERALAIRKQTLGEKNLDYAVTLGSLGELAESTGDYAAARRYDEAQLAIIRGAIGEQNSQYAVALSQYGGLLRSTGDYAAAGAALERSLELKTLVFGRMHPARASSLYELGYLHERMHDFDAARAYYEQALAVRKATLGERNANYAIALYALGRVHEATAAYESARECYARGLEIIKQTKGENHRDYSAALAHLGHLLDAMGDYAAAEPYFQQCLEMDLRVLGESHPDTAKSLDNLSGLESAVGRWTEAAAHRDAARRIVRRHIARVLPGLSEKEQLAFLQNHVERSYHASLSLGLANRDNQTIRAQSASWLLNGKAVAQESLAERARLALESLDPQTAEVVKDLQVVRRQLATLGLAAPRPGQEAARKAQLAELESQEQALSRRLATATGERVAEEPWIELDAVRSALPADGVLVDIARFTMRNFAAKPGEPNFGPARYAAWIIPPAGKGDVQLVDLGPADQIDAAVAAAQGAMQAAMGHGDMPGLIQSLGEQAAEQAVLEALRQLSQLALAPIVAEAGDAKQWIVSPDAALWLVPWGALPLADGRYAVEAYKIRYLISGRDLVARRGGEVTTSKPAIMADPNYDLGPADSLAATRAVLRGVVLPSDDQLRRLSSESSAMPKVARLPGTAAEAKAIESQLASYAHQSPNLYTDIYALEAVFKALRRPKALVLATHGFFLPDQQADGNDKGAEAGQAGQARGDLLSVDGKPIENPLLRCGLLLAGCNARSKLAGLEDGVLTGMEIVGADLHGTELVVLSACETGLGKVRNGEGVAGLRQAFQMAGARAVVATLWQVPDRQSSQLMTNFFANLAAGQSKVDALRNAQLALIEARREKHAAAHPFFWAAFTLTGE